MGAGRRRLGSRHTSYLPAIDGLRGVAVGAVLLFHGGFTVARGGFLGVTVFFVLSGFLMGRLLLAEREECGRIDLLAFWGRRVRRLVPAALVLIALVIAYVAVSAGNVADGVVGDGFASALWVANWRFVLETRSYADLFSDPSPFQHMWSLAVEEQFYLLLPVATVLLLGRHGRPRRARFAVVVALAVAASTTAAVVLAPEGSDTARAYYGTDSRAAEPLVGVLLAVAVAARRRAPGRAWRVALDVLGVGGLVGLVAMTTTVDKTSPFLWQGGLLLAALLSVAVVAAATEPSTRVARLLAVPPLVALGRVSYGVYLYHWPVFLLLDREATGLERGPLFAVRCAVTLALATLSYILVEAPVRWGNIRVRVGVPAWANATVGLLAVLVLVTPTTSPQATLFASAPSEAAPVPTTAPAPAPTVTTGTTTTPKATVATSRVVPTAPTARPSKGSPSSTISPGAAAPAPPSTQAGGPDRAIFEEPPPTAPPPPAAQTPAGPPPLKVAVVGDSMAGSTAIGLLAWSQARQDVVVYDLTTSGCPLSRGGKRRRPTGEERRVDPLCGWWADSQSDRSRKLAAFAPDVVVMHDALNEIFDRKLDAWPTYRRPGELLFDRWLADEYAAATGRLRGGKAKLLVLDAACANWQQMGGAWEHYRDGDGDRRLAAVDAVTEGLARFGHRVAQLSEQLCPGGRFSQTVAGVENARPDGYHLTKAAATALAQRWLGPLLFEVAGRPPA